MRKLNIPGPGSLALFTQILVLFAQMLQFSAYLAIKARGERN
jgi:hypothetical protein